MSDEVEIASFVRSQSRVNPESVTWTHPRPGKRVALWETEVTIEGIDRPVRRVLRLTERTIGTGGQHLILEFGANDRAAGVFIRMNTELAGDGIGVP